MTQMGNNGKVLCPDVAFIVVRVDSANPHFAIHVILFNRMEADINGASGLGHIGLGGQMLSSLGVRVKVILLSLHIPVELEDTSKVASNSVSSSESDELGFSGRGHHQLLGFACQCTMPPSIFAMMPLVLWRVSIWPPRSVSL